MNWIKKHKIEIIIVFILTASYFFLRLFNILHLPIFTDEAIYIRWSQIAKQDASWRFISLTDGKQPMFVWIAMLVLRLIHDPLLAGRLVSVFAGALVTIGLFFLTYELFQKKWVAFMASAIYVIFPFGLVYDRMALYESLVTASIVWGIYIEVLLAKRVKLALALIAGLIVGAGMLTKTNAFFNLYFLPFTLLVFDWKQNNLKKQLVKWGLLALLTAVLANGYYSILRLSPFYGIINEKNHLFYYPFSQWIQHPFRFFQGNLNGMWNWFIAYFGWVPFGLAIGSFFVFKKYTKEKILVLFWAVPPFFGLTLLGKVLYPRWILPMAVPLLPLVALCLWYLLTRFKNIYIRLLIIILFCSMYIRADYYILQDFAHAPIAKPDLGQYVLDWPSGGGVNEAVAFFKNQAQNQKIYIGTQGTFGLMPFALEIYLVDNPNITLKGIWPVDETAPKALIDASRKMPTYVLFYQPCNSCTADGIAPVGWPLTQELQITKAPNKFLTVYKVNPPSGTSRK